MPMQSSFLVGSILPSEEGGSSLTKVALIGDFVKTYFLSGHG
jgi:hypothetical protein